MHRRDDLSEVRFQRATQREGTRDEGVLVEDDGAEGAREIESVERKRKRERERGVGGKRHSREGC